MSLQFQYLKIAAWRQFKHIELEIHPRLTVITGINGSGKSTLLNIFSDHLGWGKPFVNSVPAAAEHKLSLDRLYQFFYQKFFGSAEDAQTVGEIHYTNESKSRITNPKGQSITYNLEYENKPAIEGFFISPYRQVANYQQVALIPLRAPSAAEAYEQFKIENYQVWNGGHTGLSPIYRLKEAIMSMATFGEGNKYVQKNPEALKVYLNFVEILKKVMPPKMGFYDLKINPPDLYLQTKSGSFLIDAASGGITTLISIAWQIYLYSLNREGFVVVIDEPENHLHPSMQRSLFPSLINAFPNVQFIVATHSPHVITSVKDSNVMHFIMTMN